MRGANGDVYAGARVADKMEGRGTFRFADGRAEVGRYKADAPVGEGAQWSADLATANRMQDGQPVARIPLEEAARIAQALGLAVPPRAAVVQVEKV